MKKMIILSCVMATWLLTVVGCSSDEPVQPLPEQSDVARTMPEYDMSLPDGVEAVDLGLSVKWATCNFGANHPMEYGGHFAWGDPSGALWSGEGIVIEDGYYSWNSDLYGGNPPRSMEIAGTKQDVVAMHWGNGWRMPTMQQAAELCNYCTWTLKQQDGHKFYHVTGPNGNSIDLPLCGTYGDSGDLNHPYRFSSGPFAQEAVGYYWTSTIASQSVDRSNIGYKVKPDVYLAWAFILNSNRGDITHEGKFLPELRCVHMTIRPVHHK